MKKRFSSVIILILALILLSIPAIMVFFYRSEFENYEIGVIDEHLADVRDHVRMFSENTDNKSRFLQILSSYMTRYSDRGALLILDEDYTIVFPEDAPSREARQDLADEFAEAIQRGTLQNSSYFDSEEGLCFRVAIGSLVREDSGKLYTVAYYDTDRSGFQIDRLESIYLQIAVFSVLLILFVIVLLYWNYYRYMQLLSEEILRIGTGDRAPAAIPVSVGASETVRRSVNAVMEQLRLTENRRDTLVRAVIHFIRNHLMAVDGYAQGMETGVFSPGEAAAKIRAESFAMEDLLYNLSVRSYIREQTMPDNDEVLYLPDEIEDCLSKYRRIADQKNVVLSLLPGSGDLSARGSKRLMETVLGNLVSNAIRYASSKVTVSVQEADGQITVRVADDGKGVSDKDMPHLFQPMYKGAKGNIGIGLSVALDAARYMNGDLRAENDPQGGAVFIFTLPAT